MTDFPEFDSNVIDSNNTHLHYITYNAGKQPLLMLHGLTANAHAFDGLVARGLADDYTVISLDQRGRGLSGYPAFAYSIPDHAEDVINLLDHLGIDKVNIAGHSFGGLMSYYLAANFPDRFEKLVILDAAAKMNPNSLEMLQPTLGRLDKQFASWDAYINEIKSAPFSAFWEPAMERYYMADVKTTEEGGVTPRPILANILQVAYNVGATPWDEHVQEVKQPTILINGVDEYSLGEPLLPECNALETVEMMPDAKYVAVDGNHHTMLYGSGAEQIVATMRDFLK